MSRLVLVRAIPVFIGTLATFTILVLLFSDLRRGVSQRDFVTYYVSAQLLRSGVSPYDQQAELTLHRQIGPPPDSSGNSLYYYPPSFLLAMLPFAARSPSTATLLWLGLQVVVVWPLCLYLLRRQLPAQLWLMVCAWSLPWAPVAIALVFGQVSLPIIRR
jgi:hypothetical protein